MEKINRRQYLNMTTKAASALMLTAAGGQGLLYGKEEDIPKNPNIVFIIADDMGWSDIGYNNPEIKTPNLDRLANEGIKFTQHYAMPTCTPTRVAIMTGRYPSRYGVTGPDYGKIFDKDTVTLATALNRAGYHTCISGKWHMGSPPEWVPLNHGFDHSYGYFHGQIDPYTHHYKTGVRSWHRNDKYIDEEGHATDLITNEAIRVIESDNESPFFLYVAYSVPHYPLKEPEKWTSMYDHIDEPSRRWFNASVTHMDDGIGRIVDALDRTDKRKNTLIVFVSDNGGQKSWHNEKQYKGRYADKPHSVLGNNEPWRGWKGQVYEGGIRVPALANWPGVLKKGEVVDAPIHIVDWMPTLCSMVGYDSAEELDWDGKNVWPVITGEVTDPETRTMYWKTGRMVCVRKGNWKLISSQDYSKIELYNIEKDPYEKNDVSEEHPKKVNQLKELLMQIRKKDRNK